MIQKNKIHSRVIALGVLSSLIASSIPSLLASASDKTGARSPEMTLLIRETAISGENISSAQQQKNFTKALEEYDAQAPKDGRQERMKEALVGLNMMSAERAQDFQLGISKAVNSEMVANPAQTGSDVVTHAASSVVTHLKGAEFSRCEETWAIGALLVATIAGCISEYDRLSAGDIDSNSYSSVGSTTTSTSVSKTNPNEIYPAIGAIAAGILLIADIGEGMSYTCQ
jgi:hypothetical protein